MEQCLSTFFFKLLNDIDIRRLLKKHMFYLTIFGETESGS